MKKGIRLNRLNELIKTVKRWFKRNGNDDDLFNHPFAVL
jgi:hypothetical protein